MKSTACPSYNTTKREKVLILCKALIRGGCRKRCCMAVVFIANNSSCGFAGGHRHACARAQDGNQVICSSEDL